ncbi:peptidoglycan DD-metalloendopeptidase family protein [Paenibacillus sp. CMAA1364]
MNEQNKNQNHEETPKLFKGEPVNQPSSWKRLLSKRWVYPAAYMAAAAIILTMVWVYQDSAQKSLTTDLTTVPGNTVSQVTGPKDVGMNDGDTVAVIGTAENMTWPVADGKEVSIVKPYYDPLGSKENHEEAMVQYNDVSVTNNGIDLAREDNKSFEVRAALSGKVSRVEVHPLMGTVIEITHAGKLKTVYQSLADAKVKVGDEIAQGNVLASAGRSEMESDLGNHVHFEVYNDGDLVNPSELLPPK